MNIESMHYSKLSFWNTAEEINDVEMEININHSVDNIPEDPLLRKTISDVHIFPRDSAALDGELNIEVSLTVIFSDEHFSDLDESYIHNQTIRMIFPYLRVAVSNLLSLAEFPVLYLPHFDPEQVRLSE